MRKHIITAKKSIDAPIHERMYKGDVETIEIDFSPWAEDNNTLTGATWTVEGGQAAVSNQSFSDNTATANITATQAGKSLIQIEATDGTIKKNVYLSIYAHDPEQGIQDYV